MTSISTVTMFYVGNYADMDTDESNYSNENTNVVLGLHDSLQFVDVTQFDIDDDDLIFDDEFESGDYISYDTGSGATTAELDSSSLYNADILLGDGSTLSVPVLVIQSTTGDVFVSEYPAYPLDGLSIQSIDLVSLNTSHALGINAGKSDVQDAEITCFAAGTLIETPQGARPVEALRPGDEVLTLDRGHQQIRWVRQQSQSFRDTGEEGKPILIAPGALGDGRPAQALVVSPQHRVLVGGRGQLDAVFPRECLAPTKALTGVPGIRAMAGKRAVTWVHFACDRHEVVIANGCATETLLLGPMALRGTTEAERRRLRWAFGDMAFTEGAANGPPARECLPVQAARSVIRSYMAARPRGLTAKGRTAPTGELTGLLGAARSFDAGPRRTRTAMRATGG
ncbi:MAG: Hint domain-containing protein [Pseudomonadota bacterium]